MTESGSKKSQPLTYSQGLRMVMGHGPYVRLVIGFLFTSLAFMVTQGFIIRLIFECSVHQGWGRVEKLYENNMHK